MRYTRFIALVMVFLLALTPMIALAQDGVALEEYESEDGSFYLEVPEGWVSHVDDEAPMPNVLFFNDEESLALYDEDEDPESGDAAFFVFVLPVDFFALLGMELTDDMSAEEVTAVIASFFFEQDEGEDDPLELGEIETGEFDDGRWAGYFDVEDDVSEGGMFVFELGEGLLGVVMVSFYPGEYDDETYDVVEAVVESIEFNGTADEVMEKLFGDAMTDDEDTDDDTDDTSSMNLDGKALVDTRCSVCHTTDQVYAADKDEAGWTATVDRMIGNGAQLNDDERAAVIAFLSGLN